MDIATFQSNLDFIKSLYFREEWKDKKCRDEILAAVKECNEKIEEAFGKSMHRLNKHKPTVEAVEEVVKKFPSTLSYEHEDRDSMGRLPIHTAADFLGNDDAPEYAPVLAKEGMKHKVGGEDARGGLLTSDPIDRDDEWNTLQILCYTETDVSDHAPRVAALKELRKMGLFVKKDIVEHDLLYKSLYHQEHDIFDYLVDWDPDALINSRRGDLPLIHSAVECENLNRITNLLKAGFKYHPDICGLLFIENDDGTTALEQLYNSLGEDASMDILYNILSSMKHYPILHHIFTKVPKHKEIFAKRFPWAGSLKDHNGRSLQQAILAAGPKVMNENEVLFAMLTDNQIQEKDPISTLFPFAAMAVGEHADLDRCFYLLRRHPSVMDKRSRVNLTVRQQSRKKRKVSKL